ncbi:MAG: aminotransferase class I/II-fold pyridoxal phosphate-dependent enzyme [Propionibacteriaceae bacterium]|nr:aminotransferase class I/II-fold pyridoxal phosphate-dependent enzyme [Propionibacteriaceae bacterium]
MINAAEFDLIDLAHLRGLGSLKWSKFPDTIGAFVAEMDFGTAPVVTEALHAAVDVGLFGYLPESVSVAMSEASAAWHRSVYGWDIAAKQVHPIADVIKGLEIAIEHYSRPGAPVILPTPAYMPFLSVPSTLRRKIIQVPLILTDGAYRMDLDGLEAAYRAGGDLLILCNPYNPVGKVFTADELTEISEVVTRHGGRVFSDEIHSPLVFSGAKHVPYASLSAETAGHSVTATSASKAWNIPGLKCAQFIVSNDADTDVWNGIGYLASHGASNLGVVANTAAFSSGRGWLEAVLAYLDTNRLLLANLIAQHLPGVRYAPPQGTYIAWLDCRDLAVDMPPAEFFRARAGVALTDGADCGEAGEGFVRMVFATPRPILEQAVTRMGQAVASAPAGSPPS